MINNQRIFIYCRFCGQKKEKWKGNVLANYSTGNVRYNGYSVLVVRYRYKILHPRVYKRSGHKSCMVALLASWYFMKQALDQYQ